MKYDAYKTKKCILCALCKPTNQIAYKSSINDEITITTSSTTLDYTIGSVPDIDEVSPAMYVKDDDSSVKHTSHSKYVTQGHGNYRTEVIIANNHT